MSKRNFGFTATVSSTKVNVTNGPLVVTFKVVRMARDTFLDLHYANINFDTEQFRAAQRVARRAYANREV